MYKRIVDRILRRTNCYHYRWTSLDAVCVPNNAKLPQCISLNHWHCSHMHTIYICSEFKCTQSSVSHGSITIPELEPYYYYRDKKKKKQDKTKQSCLVNCQRNEIKKHREKSCDNAKSLEKCKPRKKHQPDMSKTTTSKKRRRITTTKWYKEKIMV